MKITQKELEHVTHLARLNLSDQELDTIRGQLDNILSYIDKLGELDTSGIEPTTHVFSVNNAFREDIVTESLSRKKSLANAPQQNNESFQVPKII